MNVCYIITKANEIGGAQIHVRDLANRLKIEKNNVSVIVGEKGALVDELNKINVPVYIVDDLVREITLPKDVKAIFKIRSILKKIKPDIISLHSSKAGIVGRLAAIGLGIPVIFTAHGWSFANGVGKKRQIIYCLIERMLSCLARKIITVSQQDKDLAIKYKVSNDVSQIVIHNGMPEVNFSSFKTRATNDELIKLISIARFSEQKDHKSLFLALSNLTNYKWRLTLVGKGPLMSHYENFSKSLGIYDRIDFLGERNDVANLLASSDVFLLISNWEGFPRSILEAMRGGLPVIASEVGGVNESVENGKTGFLVPKGDVETLTNALIKVLTDESLRHYLGVNGRESFLRKYTFDIMYNKTISVYRSLL
ncbi:glycosyltransferase family 4 protein [Citrobacter portucalensis]|uniref:glycosyltransferase family 4 protein n=1 Tax=Citrobacter TaxID=544 RepID=UPI00129C0AD7|nr:MULTISPECIES: glycosyltransferase family 4 protein [Citrobacter]MBW7618016.1 glycosyltransferase family 4 protein [Citrobacter portucalensis]MBW7637228.1 glycosyltransferase family 4 protein [Citrobacter portucalensis]MCA2131313.1 glycosyltransferase family 4 protein [Citrobacter portucalensis]MCA2141492.1 glycosyltransferase family 4 protein [Citrobacter portucalensis]MCA2147085.1 glycosyltransferase family 4 protein [Citrobacter portucalensis]